MRNILYIAYLYPPLGGQGLPGAQRTVKFIRYLECDNAHVLTVKPDAYPVYAVFDNKLELPINNETIHRTKIIDVFNALINIKQIVRHKNNSNDADLSSTADASDSDTSTNIWYEHRNRSLWQRLKDFITDVFYFPDNASSWIIPAVYEGIKLVKKHKITVIFATGSPWSSLTIAYIISRLSKVTFIVDLRDPWIDNPFHVSKGKLLDAFAVKLERTIIKHAGIVSANTEELRDSFLKRYPEVKPEKFITLPNGFDVNDYQHISFESESETGDDETSKLVLAHAGFLYGTRDPSPIIDAINKISKFMNGDRDIVFMQIGKISLNYDFHENFKDLLSDNKIVLIDQLPYKECLQKLSKADVLLNIQPKTMTQVPSKIYDYFCLNLPILTVTPPDGALGNMIRRYGLGDIYAPEDIDGISTCIDGLWQRKQKEGSLKINYPNREIFDVRKIAGKLSGALSRLGL